MPVEGGNDKPKTRAAKDVPAALEVIRPDLTPIQRRRRRRMLLQSMLITFVLTFGWIGALIAIQMASSTAYNFNHETRAILEHIRDNQAANVYDEASPVLHETMVLDRFEELAGDIRSTFGEYRDILAIKRVEKISGPGGETARVKATIQFDRARTTGWFSYHYFQGAWRLMQISIDIPDELAVEAISKEETKAARYEAPAEIYGLAETVLSQLRDDQLDTVYDQSADLFKKSIDRETFVENQAAIDRQLGKFVRIIDTTRTKRNKSRSMATLTLFVEYELAKTTVVVDFRKSDGDQWALSYYKVEVPLPRIPTQKPERPPE